VADSSLRKDRGVKTVIYARYGIPEYWIVNVKNSTVEVHRDPDPEAGRYRSLLTAGTDATLSPTGLPGVSISVRELFA
jgi:Uma2 family endonuclease